MPRLKLTIAYVGTQYHGWQTQARKNASPLPTIQVDDGQRVRSHPSTVQLIGRQLITGNQVSDIRIRLIFIYRYRLRIGSAIRQHDASCHLL